MIEHRTLFALPAIAIAAGALGSTGPHTESPAAQLELIQYVADSTSFHVNSVIVAGPTEAILIDTQYRVADAERVADQIAATGKRLKAIFITHPDHDHFSGAAPIVERFPGTPVYMTEAAMHHFEVQGIRDFQRDKERQGASLADSVIMPQVLPSTRLTVDGEIVEIIPDLQGDVLVPVNSVVWIPSLQTLIAGDLVFNGVHVWLGASDAASRLRWRNDLAHLAARHPMTVIPGHKPSVDTPDTPGTLNQMIDYLADFDDIRRESADGMALATAMRDRYPWKVAGLLVYSARREFP